VCCRQGLGRTVPGIIRPSRLPQEPLSKFLLLGHPSLGGFGSFSTNKTFSECHPVGLFGSLELSFLDNNVLLSRDGVAYLKLGDTKIKWNWRLLVCVSLMLNCPPRCCWIGTIKSSHDIKYPSLFKDYLGYFSFVHLYSIDIGNKPASRYVIGLLIPAWTSLSHLFYFLGILGW